MSWNRAKSLMLLLFMAINVILAYFNFVRPYQVMAERSGNEAIYLSVLQDLQERNIVLIEKPETLPVKATPLLLGYTGATEAAYSLAESFFSGQPHNEARLLTSSGGQIWRYTYGDQILEIAPDGRWTYRRTLAQAEGEEELLAAAQAQQIAENFLKQHNIERQADLKLYQDNPNNEPKAEHTLIWRLVYNNKPIFDAQLSVKLHSGQIAVINNTLSYVSGEAQSATWTNNANDILLRLSRDDYLLELAAAAERQEQQLVIQNLTLGYFTGFNIEPDPGTATITAYPTWRVLLQSGEALYYDALNGKRMYP